MRKPVLFSSFFMALALAIAFFAERAAPVLAHPVGPNVPYTVSAEDEWGNALRTFHRGNETFLLGSYGRRYNIRIRNQTYTRVEAVVSVDGRDVVSGRVGDFVGERGYLIEPYGSVLIEGFRKSLDEVAAFRFSEPQESYSARMGTPENVGVIGVAFFPERPRPAPVQPRLRRYEPESRRQSYDYQYPAGAAGESKAGRGAAGLGTMNAPAASAPSSAPRKEASSQGAYEREDSYGSAADESASVNNLGTEYGEARENHVQEVSFRRAHPTRPAQVVALRYDDEQGLIARGIRLYEPPVVSYERPRPNPFPRNHFAPPPP